MKSYSVFSVLAIAALVLVLTGCPPRTEETAKTTFLLSASGDAVKADVPLDDIEALFVTVTKDSVIAGEGDGIPDVNAGDPEDPDPKDEVVVFEGAMDVNLLDLTDVAQVLSAYDLEADTYNQIRLSISDPEMHLFSMPGVAITDIQLTANGRLFVTEKFTVTDEPRLILLTFEDVKIVIQGNGGYTWTPQVQADVSTVSAEVVADGVITAVDSASGNITVDVAGSEVPVAYGAALVYLPTDTGTATGDVSALVVGASVHVEGTLFVDGSIQADAIHIL